MRMMKGVFLVTREYELLQALASGRITIFDLSKMIDISDITAALRLGLVARKPNDCMVLTDTGASRLLALRNQMSDRQLALRAIASCDAISGRLEQSRQDLADHQAKQADQHAADAAQRQVAPRLSAPVPWPRRA